MLMPYGMVRKTDFIVGVLMVFVWKYTDVLLVYCRDIYIVCKIAGLLHILRDTIL